MQVIAIVVVVVAAAAAAVAAAAVTAVCVASLLIFCRWCEPHISNSHASRS